MKRRIRWGRVAGAVAGGALAVLLLTGFYDGPQRLVKPHTPFRLVIPCGTSAKSSCL